jgi:hypothetical protein
LHDQIQVRAEWSALTEESRHRSRPGYCTTTLPTIFG